jgi:hypothetical protein
MPTSRKFTTSTTGEAKDKPVAVLARQRLDAVVGSVIRLDGRESFDPQNLPLTWNWRFVQVPIGSALTDTSFRSIRPKSRAVSFTPDKIGTYIVELVVNNGDVDSDPVTATVGLQISRVPCGENIVPDAHFLWDYISDFWRLVDDRAIIESIWSSVIQTIGSELITLWDTDNNKSLATIQSKFQRRWQAFHPVTELIGEVQHRVITGKTDSGNSASTGVSQDPTSGSTDIILTTLGEPRDVTATDFTNLRGNYGVKGRIIVVNGVAYTLSRAENNEDDSLSLAFVDEVVVPAQLAGVSWRIPHLLHMPGVDLEEAGARAGDVLVFEVTREDIGLSAELKTQVVGVDRKRLGFEFTLGTLVDGDENIDVELFKQLALDLRIVPPDSLDTEVEAVAKALIQFIPIGINLSTRPFTKFRITFKAKKIIHNTVIATDENLVSAPALQEKIKDAPVTLRENYDYIVEDGKIQFVSGLFTPEEPAPEKLWAECAWYLNDQAIENNFGRLVNLRKDTLTKSKTRAPYLSAVKGLFYAYTNDASVANLRLALQILLGLPFTEERGVVLEIDDNFSVDSGGNVLGRILMEDLKDDDSRTGVRRFHFYSPVVGIEENRDTGELIKAGDVLEQFVPLSKGVEVVDYIKDPNWWVSALSGLEVLKFFAFQATIDSEVFDFNDVTFAQQVLSAIKPAYTRVITAIVQSLADDLDVEDDLTGKLVLKLYDATWGLEHAKRFNDYNGQGVTIGRASSSPLHTRTLVTLSDVTTTAAAMVEVQSATGWGTLVRGRDDGSFPYIEGDILAILPGQPGAGALIPGFYEIDNVIDANNLELRNVLPGPNPDTYAGPLLVPGTFPTGINLKCSILRRENNPAVKGSDLSTNGDDATSAGSTFITDGVGPGDHLIIESGANQGEYIVDVIDPSPSGYPRASPSITETAVKLKNLDGSAASLSTLSSQSFRVIRPSQVPTFVRNAQSIYNGGQTRMELAVEESSNPVFDVFTPGMVGKLVSVSESENTANDGVFLITQYLSNGRVVIDNAGTTSDASADAVIQL